MMKPSVTILIINYNGFSFVTTAIDSALGQQYDGLVEIVVVDNASTDESLKLLREIPGIRLMESDSNNGYGAGVNFALPSISTDYVALLNPDARAKPEWLATMIPFMAKDDIALASSIISAGSQTYFAAGRYFASLGVAFESLEPRVKTDWLTGCALIASLAVLKALDGFDDGFFLYSEDVDLCIRARRRGLRIKVLQEVLVDHPDRARSTNALGHKKLEIIFESRGRLIGKHVAVWMRPPALVVALMIAAFWNRIPPARMIPTISALLRGFRNARRPRTTIRRRSGPPPATSARFE